MVISGPSGCGKSTLIGMLLENNRQIEFCVSHTTRPRRKHEIPGEDYYFLTEKEFMCMVKEKRFVEWARVYSHYYGTSWDEVLSKDPNKTLVLDIDVQGARNIKKQCPRAWFVFVIPPSLPDLRKRLTNRHRGESQAEIRDRLARAEGEMSEFRLYDFIVLNDRKERALSILECIHTAFCHRQVRKKKELIKLLGGEK